MNFQEAGQLRSVGPPVADEDVQVLVEVRVVSDAELAALNFDTWRKQTKSLVIFILTIQFILHLSISIYQSFKFWSLTFNNFNTLGRKSFYFNVPKKGILRKREIIWPCWIFNLWILFLIPHS